MVYYSRYYIHETLLVAFSFGALICVCRYLQTPRAAWAIAAGTSVGLMVATKETWVIAVGSMAGALVLAWARVPAHPARPGRGDRRRTAVHLAAAALSAIAVACLFYSSFFRHPHGIVDSVTAFTTYLARAGGDSWHVHPWHYYFGLLSFTGANGGPIWTEGVILALALAGAVASFARGNPAAGDRRPLAFLGAYALLMAAVYAAIPYKTPWCLLGFLHAFILLAGVGGTRLLAALPAPLAKPIRHRAARCRDRPPRVAGLGRKRPLCVGPAEPLGLRPHRAWRLRDRAARRGPRSCASGRHGDAGRGDQRQEPVAAPWYLRRFEDVRWETAPVNDGVHAPVILATPDMESAIREKLFEWRRPGERELYVPIFDRPVELRPQVEVRGYAAKTLWDVASVR